MYANKVGHATQSSLRSYLCQYVRMVAKFLRGIETKHVSTTCLFNLRFMERSRSSLKHLNFMQNSMYIGVVSMVYTKFYVYIDVPSTR